MSPKPHYYAALDKNDPLKTTTPLRDVVEQVENMNYGTHRFLSHLIDIRRQRLNERIERYEQRGDDDIAMSLRRQGDPLADGIEKLLDDGLF